MIENTHFDASQRQKEVKGMRWWSKWFLKILAVQVVVMGRDNWRNLESDVEDENVLAILAGLTHKDYVDGPVLWELFSNPQILLQYVAMTEGFADEEYKSRNNFAKKMAGTLYLSRSAYPRQEIEEIRSQRSNSSAVAVFMTGNRKLNSEMKAGVTALLEKDNDVMYPFVLLSDSEPVFSTESSMGDNKRQLLSRSTWKRKGSKEIVNLFEPINKLELQEMAGEKKAKHARKETMAKLEVFKAFAVLYTAIEALRSGHMSLFSNPANIVLFEKCFALLIEEKERVNWLISAGYFEKRDLEQTLDDYILMKLAK